jgi:MraZ protein
MTQFLGTHHTKLDSKGRVSVPAPFRAALRALRANDNGALEIAMILRPSHQYPCIEAWPEHAFHALTAELDRFNEISEEHEDLATALFADAYPLESDKEGRIVLPDDLLVHAGIAGPITFMGIGSRFQIWEPAAAASRREQARQRIRDQQAAMRGQPPS